MLNILLNTSLILMVIAAITTNVSALEIGTKIKAVGKSGKSYEGKIAGMAKNKTILFISKEGCRFQMPLDKIRSLDNVEGEFYSTENGTKVKVVKITTKDGQTVYGGIAVSAAVAFESDSGSISNLMLPDVHRFSTIQISQEPMAVSSLR
jgi:hypothetical protein